jgi:hypothetical protein
MTMRSEEWFLRFDHWGHEPTKRIELRSNGAIQVSRGRKTPSGGWQSAGPDWRGAFSGRVAPSVAVEAYQAARRLVQSFTLTDFPNRDYDSGYEVTLVTARGSFQIRVLGSELYKDKVLRERFVRLVQVVNGTLPLQSRFGSVEGTEVRNE